MRIPSVLAAIVVAACASGADVARPGSTASDSAGVVRVVSSAPLWKEGEAWTLSPAPEIEIGKQSSDTLHQFTGVISVARLDNGNLVVANRRPYIVRVYDSTGKFIRNIGREGQGPGEYQYITRVMPYHGDSLFVGTERGINTIFSVDGKTGRAVKLEPAPRNFAEFAAVPWARAVFPDGSILMIAGITGGPNDRNIRGVRIDSLEFNRYSSEGKLLNSMGQFDEYERFVTADEHYVRSASPERVWSVMGDKLYTGNGREFEIRVYEMTGALKKIVRIDTPAVRLTADSIAKRKEKRLAAAKTPEDRQNIEKIYSIMDFPDSLPHFDDLMIAGDGSMWVKRHTNIAPLRWYIFDAEGRWLGSIGLPERFTLHGISGDLVYGVARDADDVEVIQVYRLRKSGSG